METDRRRYRRILQLHKVFNSKTPSYLKNNYFLTAELCSVETFVTLLCKSNRHMNSFFPDAIASWDIFIKHFGDIPSFDILKEHINAFFRPKSKSIFGIHDPL